MLLKRGIEKATEAVSERIKAMAIPISTRAEIASVASISAQAGQVASVTVITDRDSGTSKGFAFIEMTTEAEAESKPLPS
jgi:chaperonin GroEL (HSP60 family)